MYSQNDINLETFAVNGLRNRGASIGTGCAFHSWLARMLVYLA